MGRRTGHALSARTRRLPFTRAAGAPTRLRTSRVEVDDLPLMILMRLIKTDENRDGSGNEFADADRRREERHDYAPMDITPYDVFSDKSWWSPPAVRGNRY